MTPSHASLSRSDFSPLFVPLSESAGSSESAPEVLVRRCPEAQASAIKKTCPLVYPLQQFELDMAELYRLKKASLEEWRSCLQKRKSPFVPWLLGETIVMVAESGDKALINLLLEGNPKWEQEHRFVALRKAAALDSWEIVNKLLPSFFGDCESFVKEALYSAAQHNALETIRFLQKSYGIHVMLCKEGAICIAAERGYLPAVQLLFRPDEFIYPETRFAALLSACARHNFEMVLLLWSSDFFEALLQNDRTKMLYKACYAEKLDENLICLIIGNPVLISHDAIVSLLYRSAREGHGAICELLLDRYQQFSPAETSEAMEISRKYKQKEILRLFFEFEL